MSKLRLELDEISVESFPTEVEAQERGTVEANASRAWDTACRTCNGIDTCQGCYTCSPDFSCQAITCDGICTSAKCADGNTFVTECSFSCLCTG